ncbi:putative Tyrosinase copper-binding domain-containing protein [Seiridium cardinale]|uniref:Tyrosinase copper-binding domain-containing protein n=1 Tax=Seiridium cardinale TaxID=138064 RepID=A0ABR2XKT0_9PEZI
MKLSLILAASVASASVLIERDNTSTTPSLPAAAFPKFKTITLDQAKVGLDRDIQGLPAKPIANLTVDPSTLSTPKFGVSLAAATKSQACRAAPSYRFEWRQYSASRRLDFVRACKCLMGKKPSGKFSTATNRYEDFVALHQDVMLNVHNNALFLLWHRYFLWTFEQVLRAECGFDRTFVWWDETRDAGAFAKSDIFTSPYYFGNLPAPKSGNPVCINTGEFKGMWAHIGPGSTETTHCLSRGVTETNTAQCNTNFVNYCLARTAYADFETCLEYGPHGYGHNGIGGVMQDVWASPSDPIFWLHHAFIDRVYYAWQLKAASRFTSIDSGVDAKGTKLTLDYVITVGGIRPDVTIRDILNPLGGAAIGRTTFCYLYSY